MTTVINLFGGSGLGKSRNVHHVNILLSRNKTFDPRGRNETEDQAKSVDMYLRTMLDKWNVAYTEVTVSDIDRVSTIMALLGV